jgi:hypothetical protein
MPAAAGPSIMRRAFLAVDARRSQAEHRRRYRGESDGMKPEHVLQHRPTVLTEAQRAEYFENGYLVLPDYVPIGWVERLRAAMMETIELSRSVTESDSVFILEDGHSAETPRLHRITCPQDRHPAFWGFMVPGDDRGF